MKTQMKNVTTFSRPKDKSVEAYKTWIMEIAERLTTAKHSIQLTDREWLANWKSYWEENRAGRSNQRGR